MRSGASPTASSRPTSGTRRTWPSRSWPSASPPTSAASRKGRSCSGRSTSSSATEPAVGVSSPPPPLPDAARLVGLLADDDRRRVVAALILGAVDAAAVQSLSGLGAAAVGRALARLEDVGLVERGSDGTLVLLEQAFASAARWAAPPRDPGAGGPVDESAQVLSRFVRDGRLVAIPAAHGK